MIIEEETTQENQLAVIVKESGLDQTKADFLLKRFTSLYLREKRNDHEYHTKPA